MQAAWEEWEAWVACQEWEVVWEVWVVDSKCHQDSKCQELPEQEPVVLEPQVPEVLLLILDHHVKNMLTNLLKSKKWVSMMKMLFYKFLNKQEVMFS